MKIVTDSTADLPKNLVEEFDIEIVPLTVLLGDKSFRDYYDLSPNKFFKMLHETDEFPTTSQPSVDEFLKVYKKIGDKEDILSIHISSNLSATCQSANLALQQLPGWKVKIIDSRFTSVGLGLIILEVAKAVKDGAGFQDVINLVDRIKSSMKIYFSVDSLEHLQRGGRIGKASAFLGTMLKIKPLLALEEGMVVPIERIRGSNKLIARMLELIKENADQGKTLKAGFIWGESDEMAMSLIQQMKDSIEFQEVYRGSVGNVITSHTGPTVFGVGYYLI